MKDAINLEVTGCKDCPMLNDESDGWDTTYACNYNLSLPEENDFEITKDPYDNIITPSWCPLRTKSITITIKED